MATGNKLSSEGDRRLLRLTVIGSAIGLLLAWGVLFPMKIANLLPPHITWAGVVIIPPTMFGWLAGTGVTAILYPRHSAAWILGLTGLCGLVIAVLAISGL